MHGLDLAYTTLHKWKKIRNPENDRESKTKKGRKGKRKSRNLYNHRDDRGEPITNQEKHNKTNFEKAYAVHILTESIPAKK